jgi:hypothetical protein
VACRDEDSSYEAAGLRGNVVANARSTQERRALGRKNREASHDNDRTGSAQTRESALHRI